MTSTTDLFSPSYNAAEMQGDYQGENSQPLPAEYIMEREGPLRSFAARLIHSNAILVIVVLLSSIAVMFPSQVEYPLMRKLILCYLPF